MPTAFAPMTQDQKYRFQAAYLAYLRNRDGVPDLGTQTFDVRERFFAAIDASPVVWEGPPPVDQVVFDRNHARRSPEVGLGEATLWALATAKTNRAERYGVEYSLEHGKKPTNASEDPHSYIQVEEFYHTRILRDVLATIGLHMEIAKPNLTTQAIVRVMVHLPDHLANVVVLCGEIVGVAIFTLLLEKARVLFAAQPEALARIEALFAQILVDEVGHVHFVRSQLGPSQLAWARRIVPLVARGVLDDVPELGVLFGRDEILRRAKAADVDAAAAPYPDRLVIPAA